MSHVLLLAFSSSRSNPYFLVAFHPIRGHDVVGTSGLIFSCHDAINIGGQGSDVKQGSTFKSLLIKKTI